MPRSSGNMFVNTWECRQMNTGRRNENNWKSKTKFRRLEWISGTSEVEVTGLEPATAWSQTRNATNCATPRCRKSGCKDSLFLWALQIFSKFFWYFKIFHAINYIKNHAPHILNIGYEIKKSRFSWSIGKKNLLLQPSNQNRPHEATKDYQIYY